MRFGRRRDARRRATQMTATPGESLARRTGVGLAVFTLALIAILLLGVGLVSAAAAVGMTDRSVDDNLRIAADNMLIALQPTPRPTASPPPTAGPGRTPTLPPEPIEEPTTQPGVVSSGDAENDGGEGDGRTTFQPSPVTAGSPTPTASAMPTPGQTFSTSPSSRPPKPTSTPKFPGVDLPREPTDTFFLVLGPDGAVRADPQGVGGNGLPDPAGFAVAAAGNEDLRTTTSGGIRVRLLSEPMLSLEGNIAGVLQTGVRLSAYDDQKQIFLRTIVIASLVGLGGAAAVTWFVTRRAMSPIRAAFAAERRFVASASHELKTPVSVVRASAEILVREDLVKPAGRYLVDDVIAESDRLGSLVGDLLALASAQAGQISIEPATFDMGALVDELVERIRGVALERGVRVEAAHDAPNSPACELLVYADRERMMQLLTIFVDNALDHSPRDGVVRVSVKPVDDGSRAGRRVVVEVVDQGPGVPVDDRERIFEPFAKVAGRRRTTGTTGLGLAIARILAARQNATLAVRDAQGGGAIFSVSLASVTRT